MEQVLETIILQNKEIGEDTIGLLEALAIQGKEISDNVEKMTKNIVEPKVTIEMSETNKLLKEIKEGLNETQKVNISLNLV